MSKPTKKQESVEDPEEVPIEASGTDQEIDFVAAGKEAAELGQSKESDKSHHPEPEHTLADAVADFAMKVGEGAKSISHHWSEDGAAVASMFAGSDQNKK